jgi:hypothetical protein
MALQDMPPKMRCLTPILSSLRRESRSRPNALESLSLVKLPVELILEITGFLTPLEATCFALTCTHIYSTIGGADNMRMWRQHNYFNTDEFLKLLDQDLPDHVACYHCKQIHAIKNAGKYVFPNQFHGFQYFHQCFHLRGTQDDPIPMCWREDAVDYLFRTYIHRNFSSTVLRMAMKRYQQGADCSSLLRLLTGNEKAQHPGGEVERIITISRIVGGELLTRKQWVISKSTSSPIPLSEPITICSHIGYCLGRSRDRRNFQFWDFTTVFRNDDRFTSNEGIHRKAEEGLIQCKSCLTEFRIGPKLFGRDALIITRWQNLGQGTSTQDREWRSHVADPLFERVDYPLGSICDAFEGEEKFD